MQAAKALAAGTGPVAVDAERASGFRYSQRAYLVQLRRAGAGTFLIDPIAVPDLSPIGAALADTEWVLHAASQDLACLAEVGMVPDRLFDTELAGRLAGFDRVSLGTMTERLLRISLTKGHSADDWSIRPLRRELLVYAALDVEILLDLRDAIEAELVEQGKLAWAHAEFESVRTAPPAAPRVEPWRRTSGIQGISNTRSLAIVRALWETRDSIASEHDIAPGRLLQDRSIVAASAGNPRTMPELLKTSGFNRPAAIAHKRRWLEAMLSANALADAELPRRRAVRDPSAAPSRWMSNDPETAERFARARAVVLAESKRLSIPAENLIPPGSVRRLAWEPPELISPETVDQALHVSGVRQWQRDLLAVRISDALNAKPAPEPSEPEL